MIERHLAYLFEIFFPGPEYPDQHSGKKQKEDGEGKQTHEVHSTYFFQIVDEFHNGSFIY
jgi:hypothetical protein